MKFLYRIAGQLSGAAIKLASPFNRKARKMIAGRKEIWARIEQSFAGNTAPVVWIHAASLGEFEQGRPLVERIKQDFPDYKILLTFFSPSGYEVRKDYDGADCVVYMPSDTEGNARRFVRIVNPSVVLFIKYEIWPNFLLALRRQSVPVFLVSAIFSKKQLFFKPYGFWYRKLLTLFGYLFVQDEASRDLLNEYGITRVRVTGDTRFDRVLAIRNQRKRIDTIEHFVQKGSSEEVILVAGSSWPIDEEFIIPYFNSHPKQKLIIAPHEIHETHLCAIEQALERKSIRFSQIADLSVLEGVDCIIIDCFGLLSSIYRYADVVYIGGGFGRGIHNTAEAAVYGVPVLFGPNHKKFKEAVDLLVLNAARALKVPEDYAAVMDAFMENEGLRKEMGQQASEYIENRGNATSRIMRTLGDYLKRH